MLSKKTLSIIVLAFLSFFISNFAWSWEEEFTRLRRVMVSEQIKKRGIEDGKVLKAMLKVARHKFVPRAYRKYAYGDFPLPIGGGQTISQPYIVALMTEALALKPDDKVLEIGTGSGYQAAILAEIAKDVYTIELLEFLASKAEKLLNNLGYSNIKVKTGDGFLGWPEYAPFQAIIVTCAAPQIPQPILAQLAEGGRLVIPVGNDFQELQLIVKKEGKIITKDIIPVRFVPMKGYIETLNKE